MKGLELAKAYFDACAKEVLNTEFAKVLPYLAIGLAGSGSECYGYDDEMSQDHDFEPGFCIFLPDEEVVDRRTAFLLERMYAKLPNEFAGFTRNRVSPVGGSRHGVMRMDDFFSDKVGRPDGNLTTAEWLSVPEYGLLEATNGAVFADPFGQFTAIRERLHYYPDDVRLKKLAGRLLLMGQSGQYNYARCVARGETGAAQLAIAEFVQSTLHSIYLLNGVYMPYYKWSFRGLGELPQLAELAGDLEYLLSSGNTAQEVREKSAIIERVCAAVAAELQVQHLTGCDRSEMEGHAYAVNHHITDHHLRTAHILQGV